MKNAFYALFLILLFSACDEEVSSLNFDTTTPVVAAYIYANQPIDSIRITKNIPYSEGAKLEALDNLSIFISNGIEEFKLISIGDGYYSYLDHIVEEGKTYTLSFEYLENVISAQTSVRSSKNVVLSDTQISLEKIENNGGFPNINLDVKIVDIEWDNSEMDYYFINITNTEENPEYVNEFFESLLEDDELPATFFQSEPEIIDAYSINSRRELQTYGTYEIIVYRLNPEYAGLYDSIGNSSQSLEAPPTNIDNGLGIFTAVTPHVLYLEVKEI